MIIPLLALAAEPAAAFTRSRVPSSVPGEPGACLFWDRRDVHFLVNERGSRSAGASATFDAVRASLKIWNDVPCSDFEFPDPQLTRRIDVGYDRGRSDNANLIVWREELCSVKARGDSCLDNGGCESKYNCWDDEDEDSAATLAQTLTTFDTLTGELLDADIEFNGAGFVFSAVNAAPCVAGQQVSIPANCIARDIENTLTHELGHVLGLDHVVDPNATMFRTAQPGETIKRSLARDDIDGVCAIYPLGGPTSICFEESDGAGGGCGCDASGSAGAALGPSALMLLLGLARRRRTKASRGLPR